MLSESFEATTKLRSISKHCKGRGANEDSKGNLDKWLRKTNPKVCFRDIS